MSTASPPFGQPTLGRYVLAREIARSNDIVWEGFDPQVHRRVAVKELALSPSLTGQARRDRIERFYREARAAGAMNHANIVTIHEVGEDHGRYFIAMEYLEGQTLRERLTVNGALSLAEAVAICVALCDALEYAHQRGIVHRDIKPDNVHLLPGGQVKLTDFGIARITHEDQLTVAGQVFGTPSYMAPEQILGRPVDARTDLFSLGIMLYELITGRKPFTGDSVVTITHHIINDPTPQAVGVSPAVQAVIQRATAKEPGMRFGSAPEFRNALLAAAASRTGSNMPAAAPPTAGPLAYPGGAQQTAQYGAQTQQAVAPGYGSSGGMPSFAAPTSSPATALVAAPSYDDPYSRPRGNGSKLAGTIALSVALVGVIAVGGGMMMQKAFHNYSGTSMQLQVGEVYKKGATLYQMGDYESAAATFRQVRLTPGAGDELTRKAADGELFCYRQLGQRAQKTGDLGEAERWFRSAVAIAPADAQAKTELQAVERVRAANGAAQSRMPSLDGMTTATPTPAPPAGFPTPAATPPPATTAQFTSANNQAANDAANLLAQGNEAEKQGNMDAAARRWSDAVKAGPGSEAATEAQRRLENYYKSHPAFGSE